MMHDQIAFELDKMNLKKHRVLIEHIYDQTHQLPPKKNEHPLEMICDSVRRIYDLEINTEIGPQKAIVDLSFDGSFDRDKIKIVCNRVQHTIEQLLDTKVVIVYKKLHH